MEFRSCNTWVFSEDLVIKVPCGLSGKSGISGESGSFGAWKSCSSGESSSSEESSSSGNSISLIEYPLDSF